MRRAATLAGSWAVWWVLLAAFYLALIDNTHEADLLTGAVAATLGATLAALVRAQRKVVLRPRPLWILRTWRPVARVPVDTALLAVPVVRRLVLRQDVRGRLRARRFRAAGDDPRSVAARALTQWFGSLAPNRVVVRIDREEDVLLVHELVPSNEDLDSLGAG